MYHLIILRSTDAIGKHFELLPGDNLTGDQAGCKG